MNTEEVHRIVRVLSKLYENIFENWSIIKWIFKDMALTEQMAKAIAQFGGQEE